MFFVSDIDGHKTTSATATTSLDTSAVVAGATGSTSATSVATAIAAATAAAATITSPRQQWLPWGSHTRSSIAATAGLFDIPASGESALRPGEIVMRTLFADFTQQSERKIETVMMESSVSVSF